MGKRQRIGQDEHSTWMREPLCSMCLERLDGRRVVNSGRELIGLKIVKIGLLKLFVVRLVGGLVNMQLSAKIWRVKPLQQQEEDSKSFL